MSSRLKSSLISGCGAGSGAAAGLGAWTGWGAGWGAGAALGWGLRGAAQRGRRTAEEPTEQERRRLREEQAAFRSLQNYTVEDAYGVKTTGGQEL